MRPLFRISDKNVTERDSSSLLSWMWFFYIMRKRDVSRVQDLCAWKLSDGTKKLLFLWAVTFEWTPGCTQPSRAVFNPSKRHLQAKLQPQEPGVHHDTWASTEWRKADSLSETCFLSLQRGWPRSFSHGFGGAVNTSSLASWPQAQGAFGGNRCTELPFPPFDQCHSRTDNGTGTPSTS